MVFIIKENGILIDYLEIAKKYRGHGLSKQLLDVATKEFGGEYLWVDNDNNIARDIYFKYGFEVADEYNNCQCLRLKSKVKNISLKACKESLISNIDKIQELEDKYNTYVEHSKSSRYYLYSNGLNGSDQLLLQIGNDKYFRIYLLNKMASHNIIIEAINKAIKLGCNKTSIDKGKGIMLEIYKKAGLKIDNEKKFKYILIKE